jgi:DnaK suppressor protein
VGQKYREFQRARLAKLMHDHQSESCIMVKTAPCSVCVAKEFRRRLRTARRRLLDVDGTTNPGRRRATQVKDRPTWAAGMARLSRLNGRERRELSEIAAAEARLDTGMFGLCEACRQPIALARLRASPTARRCRRCEA